MERPPGQRTVSLAEITNHGVVKEYDFMWYCAGLVTVCYSPVSHIAGERGKRCGARRLFLAQLTHHYGHHMHLYFLMFILF